MNLSWQNDEALIEIYNEIDNLAFERKLRPIVFIIATNRKFDLTSFEQSLSESLKGSAICNIKGLIHLFVDLYLSNLYLYHSLCMYMV